MAWTNFNNAYVDAKYFSTRWRSLATSAALQLRVMWGPQNDTGAKISLHCKKLVPIQNHAQFTMLTTVSYLTMGTTGPELMYLRRSMKNGFALKAA